MDGGIFPKQSEGKGMATYHEQLRRIANRFLAEREGTPATTKEIAAWAIAKHLWEPQPAALMQQCADEFSKALRNITDPQGRKIRAKHVATRPQNGELFPLWGDIRTAPREHMEIAFQQRRQQIVGDCRQLKVDVDSYNQNYNRSDPIQLVLDFTADVEEIEALTPKRKRAGPNAHGLPSSQLPAA